jgi:hypothetical protein
MDEDIGTPREILDLRRMRKYLDRSRRFRTQVVHRFRRAAERDIILKNPSPRLDFWTGLSPC